MVEEAWAIDYGFPRALGMALGAEIEGIKILE
jgi:hypothetical protein